MATIAPNTLPPNTLPPSTLPGEEEGGQAALVQFVQSSQQYQVRGETGTSGTWNGDLIALMRADLEVSDGYYNDLLVAWLQLRLGSESTVLNVLMSEAAAQQGVTRWQEITNVAGIGT